MLVLVFAYFISSFKYEIGEQAFKSQHLPTVVDAVPAAATAVPEMGFAITKV
jgi:hypothetical protein